MRILLIGDTHGNIDWLRDVIYPTALAVNAQKAVVVGDFGYWEHTSSGVSFLNACDALAASAGIPLYWLHGNHDKWSLAMEQYGHQRDAEGFVYIRRHVLYIPQGHAWTWDAKSFRAFGGAYSVDKGYRLRMEMLEYEKLVREEEYRASARNIQPRPVPDQSGTLWFPEEEMTDDEMSALLAADSGRKDFVLSHDKPRSTVPPWNRKELPLCVPNQDRLQRALHAHQPRYWVHGHLHFFFTTSVAHRDGSYTKVISLEPDDDAGESGWHQEQTWAVIDTDDTSDHPLLGLGWSIPQATLDRHRQIL